MTVDVGSPDVSRNSRQSEVMTLAGSADSQSQPARWLWSSEVPTCVGTPDSRKSRPKPGVPASMVLLTCRLSVYVGSPDDRRKFRPSEVPTFAGSSDTDLSQARSPGIRGVGCLINCARRKSRRTSEVMTVGSPDVCQKFRHWLAHTDFWPVVNSVFFIRRKSRDLRRNFRRRSERFDFHLGYKYPSPHF